jgi:glyoxylase-like metal-dependent hydrolase (beta-lactamase superfamily II)
MTLEGTNTFVVERGGRAYVIDPGPDDDAHRTRIRDATAAIGGTAGVLVTHGHGDHAAGVGPLGEPVLWPGGDPSPFQVVPTPGHSSDHVTFLLDGVGFCGDVVLGEGSTFIPPDGGSLIAYLDSLERLRALDLELLCPGHGPWIPDPAAKLEEYIDHKLDRERKLLAALESGERSRERLLDAAWDDVPTELRAAAAVVMEAHLEKLDTEGRLTDIQLT